MSIYLIIYLIGVGVVLGTSPGAKLKLSEALLIALTWPAWYVLGLIFLAVSKI